MRLPSPRGAAPSVVLLALLTWAGCADDDELTGPGRESSTVSRQLLMNLTCDPLVVEPVMVEVCDLGSELGELGSRAFDVNDNGQVALQIDLETGPHTHIWTEAEGAQPIDFGEFSSTRPEAINNNGDIVGWTFQAVDFVGFRWSAASGVTQALEPPAPDWSFTFPRSINDEGRAVGVASSPAGTRAIFWEPAANVASPFSVAGGIMTAEDVNESNVVVGSIDNIDGVQAALFCCGMGPQVTLLGRLEGDEESQALGINDATPLQVVGSSTGNGGFTTRPFIWESNDDGGTLAPLPVPSGDLAVAEDINDLGFAVGHSVTDAGAIQAMLWTPQRELIDLGGPAGFEESFALAINETGLVAGFGTLTVGDERVDRAVLWKVSIAAPPPTLEELFEMLRAEIAGLIASGSLNRGQGRSLLVKVIHAERRLNRGHEKGALRTLSVFRWQSHVFTRVGILTQAEAEPLRELSGQIIERIERDAV